MSSLVGAGSVADAIDEGHECHVSSLDALLSNPAGIRRSESDELTLCSAPGTEALLQKRRPTPVPKLQLAALCLARLADPITFTQVWWLNFQYIVQLICLIFLDLSICQ